MDNNFTQNTNNSQEEESIDLRKLFNYFIGNIHWFILSIILALAIAYLVNQYTTKIYNISTTVLIEEDDSSPFGSGSGMNMMQGLSMFPSLQNYENQTIIIQSYSQVRRTIDNLDFNISYYSQKRLSQHEIYKQAPFEVIYVRNHPQILDTRFQVYIHNDGSIDLSIDGEDKTLFNYDKDEFLEIIPNIKLSTTIKPGERIKNDYFDFVIKINENFDPEAEINKYFFYFNSPHNLALKYQNKLTLEPMAKGSSMLKISLADNNPQKGINFLNKLTEEYIQRNLEKKNELANNTIHFIDAQLDTISKSLNIAENALQNFRSKNRVMDLSFQAQQIFEQLQNLENQKMQLDMQTQYYEYLLKYIDDNQDIESILAPSAMGVQDPLLNQLILEINQLSVKKSSLTNIKQGADFGPIQELNAQIRNAKNNIAENASNLVKSSNISLREINKRIKKLTLNINELPETERQLFGIKRKFELNDNLYTFLLERRAEAQISKASNTSDNEVIDHAMLHSNTPMKPKTMINYLIAIMLGFIVPAIIIALREFFNMKINSPDIVKKITDKPIIGYIPNSGEHPDMHIFDEPDSPWAESFRIVRTKLQFITRSNTHPTILVTSSISGEGKSFIAINLASAYALTGKKTVLVGMDLRRPQIAQRYHLERNKGVSNYLIGECIIDEIIQKTKEPNLDIIASGIIPPNPAELLSDEKTITFLDELKKRYEYIVLDTAPMSPVSDTHPLCRIVDANIFVVRNNYSHKYAFQNTIEESINNQVENVSIIINDIKLSKKSYGYTYGYQYGHKLGYGYCQKNYDTKNNKPS